MWLLGMAVAFVYAAFLKPVFASATRMRRHDEQVARRDASARPRNSDPNQWAAWLAGIASALNLLFVVVFPLVLLGDLSGGMPAFVYGVPKLALVLLAIPLVTAALAVATSIAVFSMWRDPRQRLVTRIEHTIVCTALLAFVAFTVYWRLLGIQI
jgi:hypothetical protein